MKERLCVQKISFINMLLKDSLSEPRFVRRTGDDFLIEVRLGFDKLGYLVGTVSGGIVLLRTFLFLTMQGTPESDRLRAELRLHRADIEYTMLDSLRAFANSDMSKDETLVRVFEKCGCGHLFSILDLEDQARFLPGQAKAVRDHLRITERGQDVFINGREVGLPVGEIANGAARLRAWEEKKFSELIDQSR
jgi:hypothetical protein